MRRTGAVSEVAERLVGFLTYKVLYFSCAFALIFSFWCRAVD